MMIRPGVAAVIFEDGRVLLQRRDDTGRWGLPGGAVGTPVPAVKPPAYAPPR